MWKDNNVLLKRFQQAPFFSLDDSTTHWSQNVHCCWNSRSRIQFSGWPPKYSTKILGVSYNFKLCNWTSAGRWGDNCFQMAMTRFSIEHNWPLMKGTSSLRFLWSSGSITCSLMMMLSFWHHTQNRYPVGANPWWWHRAQNYVRASFRWRICQTLPHSVPSSKPDCIIYAPRWNVRSS